jgi:hypothetical protein
MDRDWTASFSIRFRNGTCIIILDKKYNITNSSCHLGSYGSIWTGSSPKKNYMDQASVHIIFFWWRTGPYTPIWPSVPWTICYFWVYLVSGAWVYFYTSGFIRCPIFLYFWVYSVSQSLELNLLYPIYYNK